MADDILSSLFGAYCFSILAEGVLIAWAFLSKLSLVDINMPLFHLERLAPWLSDRTQ
jgi:hypothetical protein